MRLLGYMLNHVILCLVTRVFEIICSYFQKKLNLYHLINHVTPSQSISSEHLPYYN